jgi:hypothetical protein
MEQTNKLTQEKEFINPSQYQKQQADIKKTLGINAGKALKELEKANDLEFVQKMEDESKAHDFVRETEEEKMAISRAQREKATERADFLRGNPEHYRINLAELGMFKMSGIDNAIGWQYHCIPTRENIINVYGKNFQAHEGILFVLRDPMGKVYVRAMKVSLDPDVDIQALMTFVVQAENTVDAYSGALEGSAKILGTSGVTPEKISKILHFDSRKK